MISLVENDGREEKRAAAHVGRGGGRQRSTYGGSGDVALGASWRAFDISASLIPILYPIAYKYTGQSSSIGHVSGRSHEKQIKQVLGPYLLYYLD